MLGVSLNPLDWISDAVGAVAGFAGDLIEEWFYAFVFKGIGGLATLLAPTIVEAGKADFSGGRVHR